MTAVDLDAARAARAMLDRFSVRKPCGAYNYGPDYAASAKQNAALTGYANAIRELFWGGSLAAGKSDWLLLAGLQYVCVPGYSALLMRQTHPQLTDSSGLIPRAMLWLGGTDAVWHADHSVLGSSVWEFPSGATLKFGHAERDPDAMKFASAEYQYVGFDELANWRTAAVYQYVGFARVRQPNEVRDLPACPTCGLTLADVPLRTRASSNPIGLGVTWVRPRFQIGMDDPHLPPGRAFIPAFMTDNPGVNVETYLAGLEQGLDPIMYQRAVHGDWKISEHGRLFERAWFLQAA